MITSLALRSFAEKYHLRLNDRKHERKRGLETNEDTIHGRYGEIVDDPSYGPVLAVKFLAIPRDSARTGALKRRYRMAIAAGLTLKRKYGDCESTFHFDPENQEHSLVAIRLVAAKHKKQRQFTLEQRKAIAERFRRARVAV
jgi:hypothetical protein